MENIGPQLRALRRARGWSLRALAEDTDYTVGYLARVESGTSVPSLSALATLAAALGSDVGAFFPRAGPPRVNVTRAGDADTLRVAPSAREEYVVLTGRGPESAFTALVHRISSDQEVVRYRHVGERFALLLTGRVRLTIGGERHDVAPGECLHYSSHSEHTLEVRSEEPAEILWLVTPAIV